MKKIILLIAILMFLSAPAWAQQSYDVVAVWEHTGAAEYRLYQDGAQVDTFPGNVNEAPTTIQMIEVQHNFTLTAVDGWGRESEHSVPFVFEAPLLDAPGNFRFTF